MTWAGRTHRRTFIPDKDGKITVWVWFPYPLPDFVGQSVWASWKP